jgi:hypothetical protein
MEDSHDTDENDEIGGCRKLSVATCLEKVGAGKSSLTKRQKHAARRGNGHSPGLRIVFLMLLFFMYALQLLYIHILETIEQFRPVQKDHVTTGGFFPQIILFQMKYRLKYCSPYRTSRIILLSDLHSSIFVAC